MALHLWKPARLTNPGMKKKTNKKTKKTKKQNKTKKKTTLCLTWCIFQIRGLWGLSQSKMEEEFRGLVRMVTPLSEKDPLATNHQNPALLLPAKRKLYSNTCTRQ